MGFVCILLNCRKIVLVSTNLSSRKVLILIIYSHLSLYFSGHVPPIPAYLCHIMLDFWERSFGVDTRAFCMATLYKGLSSCSQSFNEPAWESFTEQVMHCEDLPTRIIAGLVGDLQENELSPSHTLLSLNFFLFLQRKNYPEFDYNIVGYVWGQYIGILALACQRVMCDRNVNEDSVTILLSVFRYVRCVLGWFETREMSLMHSKEMSCVQQSQALERPLKSWKKSLCLTLSWKFYLLVQHWERAIHLRVSNSLELTIALYYLTFLPGDALAILDGFIALAALSKPNEATLVHCMLSRNYARCLDHLTEVDSFIHTHCSQKILYSWIELGERLQITEIIQFPASFQQEYWDPKPWETCHYSWCICNGMRPCHKMKVCKGCWSVRYCCMKCQKRSVPIDMYMPYKAS